MGRVKESGLSKNESEIRCKGVGEGVGWSD